MKRFLLFLCILGVMISGPARTGQAQGEVKQVAVLPFSVHSSENITYVRDGIWDMLISRLSASEKIRVSSKQEVKEALEKLENKEPTIADVYGLGKRMNLDYAVWGSVTKIGNSISIDAKLLDVSTYKTPLGVFEQRQGMDEVIPRITDFANKIQAHVLGLALPAAGGSSPPSTGVSGSSAPPPRGPGESKVISTRQGTFTSVINPAFMTSSNPLAHKGFWMSQHYTKTFKGMDIGDVDGDGKNEVVVIDGNTVMIYRKNEAGFVLLQSFSGKSYDQYLAVDVADINDNGIDEIIVTNFSSGSPSSFVMEFQDGKYKIIASNLSWFMRVISTDGVPVLLGQTMSVIQKDKPFANPIHEIVWRGDTYREGNRMPIPEGVEVFGLTMAKLDAGAERIVALGEYDRLHVYRKTRKFLSQIHRIGGSEDLIWTSEDVFGGSNNLINFDWDERREGYGEASTPDNVYVKTRILTCDINKDGNNEILIIKNISPTGRTLKNFRMFTRSEIYNLGWDGLGLAENWRTQTIQGYVADYQVKDMDNDGKDEVVLAVCLGSSLSRSVIVAYDIDVRQAP